jgi:hypothetical protein
MTQSDLVEKHRVRITGIYNSLPARLRFLLNSLSMLRERPDHHPEENALEHVNIVLARAIELQDNNLIAIAVFHDITKYIDFSINEKTGFVTSRGHDIHGALIASLNHDWIESANADAECVEWVCSQHMRAKTINEMKKKKQQDLRSHKYWSTLEKFLEIDNMLNDFESTL